MALNDLPPKFGGLNQAGGDGIVGDDREGKAAEFEDGYDNVLNVDL